MAGEENKSAGSPGLRKSAALVLPAHLEVMSEGRVDSGSSNTVELL